MASCSFQLQNSDVGKGTTPSSCAAEHCQNRLGSYKYRLFRFPLSDPGRCRRKVQSVCTHQESGWKPSYHHRICGAHFSCCQPSSAPDHINFVPTIVDHRYRRDSLRKTRLHQQSLARLTKRAERRSLSACDLREEDREPAYMHLSVMTMALQKVLGRPPAQRRETVIAPSRKRVQAARLAIARNCGNSLILRLLHRERF